MFNKVFSRKIISLLIICGSSFQAIICEGQTPAIKFETITVSEGLPSNSVLSISRDKKGFMWFGTRSFPVRYNGTAFQSFSTQINNFVNGISIDKDNAIWFASNGNGVCKIDQTTQQVTYIDGTQGQQQIGDFYIDRQGQGWYSDATGVNRMDLSSGKYVHYSFKPSTFVWPKGLFVEDANGMLWVVGRDNGLFYYDGKKDSMICVLGSDCQDKDRNRQILFAHGCVDQEGYLWLASYNEGLIRYDLRTHEYKSYPPGNLNGDITAVAEGWDENGKRILWVGNSEGLGIFRPEQERYYFFKDIFPNPYLVNDIFYDSNEGIVWAGTSDGVIKYHPKSNRIQSMSLPAGIVQFPVTVNTFLQDNRKSKEDIWYLGLSHTGILQWNRSTGKFIRIPYPDGEATETKWMVQRPDGKIWIGTNRWGYTRPGIFMYDPDKDIFGKTALSDLANQYFSVPFFMYGVFDQQNRLWIGNSDEGIHVLDEKTARDVTPWQEATQKKLLQNNNLINDLLVDRNGQAWLGTYKGVYRADEQTGRFTLIDSVHSISVNSLMMDKQGNIWAACWGGVTQITPEGKVMTILMAKEGLFDQENHGLAQDYLGNIWIGNYEGLYYYNQQRKSLIRFTISDGLLSNNTVDKIYLHRDGKELLVGQKNGFNVVKIDQLVNALKPPALAISSFKIHEKDHPVDFMAPIELKRTDNAFSVDFIALNYRKQHDNQYAYYLEGFEEKWNYAGSNHLAYYTNLNPGDYVLHMKAGDAFGNWNEQELQLHITVLPAYYETWWFKVLIISIIVGLLYAFYRYRINQLLRLQHVRNRISADLHDELGSSLSGISIMGTLAQKKMTEQNHPSSPFLERIVEESQQISSSLDDIVWNISPKNDALENLMARMTRYASELFEAKGINYTLKMPDHPENLRLSMEQRRNFYLIFKESVNNMVKYAQCTEASVTLQIVGKQLCLLIEDNGIGFNPEGMSDRNGIKNIRMRTENLNGKLAIKSTPGKGTSIQLEFPMA